MGNFRDEAGFKNGQSWSREPQNRTFNNGRSGLGVYQPFNGGLSNRNSWSQHDINVPGDNYEYNKASTGFPDGSEDSKHPFSSQTNKQLKDSSYNKKRIAFGKGNSTQLFQWLKPS